jgi:serine/threonine protein kinase
MLLDRGYDSAIDWWQLGIIAYQMLARKSPFRGEDEDEIYDAILADEPSFPEHMARESIDFIQSLLKKNPEERLGSGTNGADHVMAHAFFSNIEWDDLYHKRVAAPFVPAPTGRTDVSNFNPEFTNLDTQAVMEDLRGTLLSLFNEIPTDTRAQYGT